jgi:hypothetical protein
MVNQKQKKVKNTKKLHFIALILFFPIFFLLELVSLYMPIVGGFAAFPLKAVECGHQPYIANRFAGSYSYTKPGDALYHGPDIFTQSKDYYCTEAEVRKAGNKPYIWTERCQSSRRVQPVGCESGGNGFDAIVPFFTILIAISVVLSYLLSSQVTKRTEPVPKKLL